MVYVPEGEFMMGCNEKDCYDWDKPYHQVFLNAYFIDKYQVTVEDYKKCVNAGICIEPPHGNPEAESFGPTYWVGALRKNSQKCPIDWIPWNTAKSYCEWVGKRLPTDAEWEKAARGTDGRRYPWGNNDDRKTFCEYAVALTYQIQEFEDYIKDQINGRNQNFCEDKTACSLFVCEPCPVGSRPKGKSPYGAMDMAGNVKEWVNDWFDKDYYKNSPYKNPTGPTFGEFRVTRNTNPCNPGWNMRAFVRGPGRTNADMGFRCARDAELKK